VNCTGPHAAELAALAGVTLALRRVPGLVVSTTPAPTRLRTIVSATDLNVRPHVGERILLHSWLLDAELGADADRPVIATIAERLLERARRLLPGLAHARVDSARVGVRPIPTDGLPVVGFGAEVANLYTVVAHSAVHLAPVLGRLAADELTGTPSEQLEPFRPSGLTGDADRGGAEDERSARCSPKWQLELGQQIPRVCI
jgi:glycine/D-amino acid oxidase-like deaminating enzyme